MAIDVIITPPLFLSDHDDPSTHAVSAIIHHQKSTRERSFMAKASIMIIHFSMASK
jgi:hypothetical protein